jgi:hypothetical protein
VARLWFPGYPPIRSKYRAAARSAVFRADRGDVGGSWSGEVGCSDSKAHDYLGGDAGGSRSSKTPGATMQRGRAAPRQSRSNKQLDNHAEVLRTPRTATRGASRARGPRHPRPADPLIHRDWEPKYVARRTGFAVEPLHLTSYIPVMPHGGFPVQGVRFGGLKSDQFHLPWRLVGRPGHGSQAAAALSKFNQRPRGCHLGCTSM